MNIFAQLGYQFTHPQAGMYRISVALFYPALLLLAAALAWAVFELGSLTAELWSRRGIRSLAKIDSTAQEARQEFVARRPAEAIAKLHELPDTLFIRKYVDALGDGTNLNPNKMVKMLSCLQKENADAVIEQTFTWTGWCTERGHQAYSGHRRFISRGA